MESLTLGDGASPRSAFRPSLVLVGIAALFFLLLFGPSNLRFATRPADAALQGQLDLFAILEAVSWMIGGGAACLAMIHAVLPRLLAANGALLWSLLFAFFALGSSAWSMLPAYTAYFALKMLIFLGVGLALTERARQDGHDPVAWLLGVFFLEHLTTLSLIAILYVTNPDAVQTYHIFEQGYRLTGGWLGDYGRAASLTCLFCAWWLVRSPRPPHVVAAFLILLVIAATFLVLSRTRTTMAATTIGLLAFALVSRGALVRWGWLLAIAAAAIWLVGDPEVMAYIHRNQRAEDIASFSGRSDAFSYLISAWKDSPLVGYGHAAGQRSWMVRYMAETGIELGGAHDALSCVLIDLGIAGAILLGIAVAVCGRQSFAMWLRSWAGSNQQRRADAAMLVCLFVKIIIQGFANGSMAAGSLYWLMLVLLISELRLRPAHPASAPAP